jgi:hypothetical protein
VRGVGEDLLDQAVALARSFRPNVAIVDLRLVDEYSSDERSGLELLISLRPARCILYSAYLKPEVTREALKKYKANDCVGKSESPGRLLEAVGDAAQESCASQRDLDVHLPSAWTPQTIVETLFGEDTDVPPEIVEDVISQLFPDSRGIKLETIGGEVTSSLSASGKNSAVFKAYPDDLEPVVVKLTPAERIRGESESYKKYVKDRLVGRFYAQLEESVEFWDLGGAVYAFMGSSLRALPSFTFFYQKEKDARPILRSLSHFFQEVWSRHYDEPKPLKRVPLFQVYDQSLRIKKRLENLGSQEKRRAFPNLSISFLNPIPWVLRYADDSLIPESRKAITHGDLHADNLFVDGEHAWAIDFGRTGPGHILRDFVELEVDILTRLVPYLAADLLRIYELSVVLAGYSDPTTPPQSRARMPTDPEVHKAWEVITRLRRLAHEVTHYRDFREYLWGLLLDSVFVATLAAEGSPQRERALLLGAVLCERLSRREEEWPPREWPQLGWEETPQRPVTAPRETYPVAKKKQTADAFLSYNSSDRNEVKTLAAYLKESGLNLWLDQWDLLPGDPWQEKLQEALDDYAACLIFWGTSGLGPWQREEMQAALSRRVTEQGYRVIPVLLPECRSPEEMPRLLQQLMFVDFRNGLDDESALQYLIEGIRSAGSDPTFASNP